MGLMGSRVIVRLWGGVAGEICCQGHLEWVVHAGGRFMCRPFWFVLGCVYICAGFNVVVFSDFLLHAVFVEDVGKHLFTLLMFFTLL